MADPCPIHFKRWKDQDVLITICHHFELGIFQVGGNCNCSVGINIDQHELIDEVFLKVGEAGDIWINIVK